MMIEEINDTSKADMSAAELLSLADSYFVDEDYESCIDAYTGALLVVRDNDASLRFRILSHRSAAFYKLKRWQDALEDAQEALNSSDGTAGLRPGESEKCHVRAGNAAINLPDYATAKGYFEKAQQLATLNRNDEKKYKPLIKQCEWHMKPKSKLPEMTAPMMPPPPHAVPEAKAASSSTDDKPAAACPKPAAKVAPNKGPKIITSRKTEPPAPKVNPHKKPALGTPKYQYYQNDKFVKVELLEPNVLPENLHVRFEEKHLTVKLTKNTVPYTVIAGNLYDEVDVEGCKTIFKGDKVLIKLKKQNVNFEWQELLGKKIFNASTEPGETKHDDDGVANGPPSSAPTVEPTIPRPYASHKDWGKIEKDLLDAEKNEKPEGDEAMNKLFQQIYATADEDTRRAMIKSYQTSGGTVLSTNWGEVAAKDYEKERTAPKGVEWKNWDGDKLPMKDDD
jgi:tetratricopeptide (TPR) repeat protein